jgi:hypothetical protein
LPLINAFQKDPSPAHTKGSPLYIGFTKQTSLWYFLHITFRTFFDFVMKKKMAGAAVKESGPAAFVASKPRGHLCEAAAGKPEAHTVGLG